MKKFESTISDLEKRFRELDRVKRGSFERVINGLFEDALGNPHGLTGDEDGLAVEMIGLIRTTYQKEIRDVIGTIYMCLNPNRDTGQFFTPHEVCLLSAWLQFDRKIIDGAIAENGFLTVNDPTCGSGNMLLAAANVLDSMGIDIRNQAIFSGSDLDPLCVKMTAIQLGLLGVPFEIGCMDVLSMEYRFSYYTRSAYELRYGKEAA